jgi:hypothetical protein
VRVESGIAAAVPQGTALPLMMRQRLDWVRSLRDNWEALSNQWNQWVLGYNPERQREMLNRLGFSDADWRQLAQMMFWSVAAALGMMAMWLLLRLKRQDPVQKAWLAFCRKLARKGVERGPAEGPLDYSARASAALPEQAQTVREISADYADLRYGQAAPPERLQAFRRKVEGFRP